MSAAVLERIQGHCRYFDSMVSLIPAKIYLGKNYDGVAMNTKYQFNKKDAVAVQQLKQGKKKARKEKLDPEMFKSTSDVQKERFAEKFKDNGGNNAVGTAQAAPSSSIHDLKSRLQARIEALKQSRIQSSGKPGKSREQILQERKERKDGSKPNQADKSAKSTEQAFKRKLDASAEPAASHDGASNPTSTDAITFNKLAIGEGHQKKKKQKLDPKAALQKIERNKAKTEKQKQSIDADQSRSIEERQTWSKLEAMAAGEKQQDDAKLLKKTIKRIEKKKEKSRSAWGDRAEAVTKQQQGRQEKRNANIKARSDQKKQKKTGKKAPAKKPTSKKRAGF